LVVCWAAFGNWLTQCNGFNVVLHIDRFAESILVL
jgi:hypothetical protein